METTSSHQSSEDQAAPTCRRLSILGFAALVVSLLGFLVPASPASAAPAAAAAVSTSAAEAQFIQLTNDARAASGLGPLSVNGGFSDQARNWSAYQMNSATLAHDPNVVGEADQIIPDWTRLGENVGFGPSVPQIQDAFMNSAPHKANILGDYNLVGVGVAQSSGGTIWVTVRFAKVPNPGPPPSYSAPGDTPGVFRGGTWYLRKSNTNGPVDVSYGFGLSNDIPVLGDWNGDGIDTPGVYRNGTWYLRNSNSNGPPDAVFGFGLAGDIPVVGDWNRDGTDTVGVFRNGTWFLRNTNSNGPSEFTFGFGWSNDIPVVGDWNGDGWDTIGVFRTGSWYLRNLASNGPVDYAFPFGFSNDTPVVGDWNGDGKTSIGVRRGGTNYLRNGNSNGPVDYGFDFGFSSDKPVTGDF
ncbi:MAG: hypothetical protein QOI95_507 [Acidimicrobiaceae bacterium]|jgi:uncharacterized protein YkwD